MKILLIVFLALLFHTNISAQSSDKTKDEVWQRELQYWKYVEQNDKANYLTYGMTILLAILIQTA